MSRRTLLLSVAISALAFHAIGCATTRVTDRLEDPARMSQIILKAVPVGSDIAKAERFMKDQGFTCRRERNAQFRDRKGLDYLHCDRSEGSIVQRRWQIAIVDRNGKVSEVIAATGLIGP